MAQNCLTKEILTEVKRLSGLLFTPKEVAIMLELDVQEFVMDCLDEKTEAFKAFHGGWMEREIILREKIFKLADSGSSPAQTMAMDILKKSKVKLTEI